jgi:hypothetical protein
MPRPIFRRLSRGSFGRRAMPAAYDLHPHGRPRRRATRELAP